MDPDTVTLFVDFPWPGNVRELENFVRRLVVLGDAGPIRAEIQARLDTQPARRPADEEPAPVSKTEPLATLGLREIARRAARDAERRALTEVLASVHWNRSEAARVLHVSYKTLLSRIAEFGLSPEPGHATNLDDPA